MIRNNANANMEHENEESKGAIYSSRALMREASYYEFCSVNYNATKKWFLLFFLLNTCLVGINLPGGDFDTVRGLGPFISCMMVVMYFMVQRGAKVGYKRMSLTNGEETLLHYELFEDKIVNYIGGLKNEYFYSQITKLLETPSFILLRLPYNVYIVLNKNDLDASVDEVKSFLISKCACVKKKRFVDCSNDKKLSLIFLIGLVTVSVVEVVLAVSMLY